MYGFTPCTISVGTAYFERIAARDPTLLAAARATPEFTTFVAATPADTPSKAGRPIGSAHIHLGPKHWCAADLCLCCCFSIALGILSIPQDTLPEGTLLVSCCDRAVLPCLLQGETML